METHAAADSPHVFDLTGMGHELLQIDHLPAIEGRQVDGFLARFGQLTQKRPGDLPNVEVAGDLGRQADQVNAQPVPVGLRISRQ
ncbi:MAG TPA: hypothetical protein ENN99_14650 [Chloroflexi bacterium]|nr:hypothetical protein [Chloroflexota bacterium]